jgi:predicted ATPase/class 3 adenylate cyclase/DNA-binding CsgD family transcriptional regulator
MILVPGYWTLASMSGPDPRTETLKWSDLGVSELPTGTVTLLLADVEGSTRLWETGPDAMADAVARLDGCLTEIVSAHHGVRPVEQGEGDSFVVAFARASDAVACALELQRAPLAPIRLRIGLHTGEVRLRDEANYIGPTINRTARLRDLAHGGQTVLSGVTEELVFEQLPAGSWLTDLGSHPLRDVARPERVTQLCHPDIRNDFPPLRVANTAVPQRLPAQFTSFVGRRTQIAEVRNLLSEHRLVTLTGAGGAGKTRLAIELATQMSDEFGGGIWYVDLAPITHPDLVPVTVARVFVLPDQPGSTPVETLVRFIGDRPMLLVLDNCEHLADACAAMTAALLAVCPAVTILATSREPIRATGEITWGIPSLSVDGEAVELFTERARQVRPDFVVTADNATTVTEICRRLDGMPLAIELAAARIRALSLTEIVDSLHDRFRLLTGGARTAVRRQQTLRASVDWSHALLTEPEQVLFRRLSVFMGGFDLDAAQRVGGGHDVERHQVLDQLTLLVDKSLVVAEHAKDRTRYRLLETVRQYALEKLGESGEADAVRGRHRDYYTSTATQLDLPADVGREERLDRAAGEIDNFRAAFAWSREDGEIEAALRLASSLQGLWLMRGRVVEGLGWLDTALAENAADSADMRPARGRALADKALLLANVGVTDRSLEAAEQALTLARELGDPALLMRALVSRGVISAYDAEVSLPYLEEAADLARQLSDSSRLSQICSWRATAALMAGDPVATVVAAQEGLELADAVGDRFVSRQCRLWLANAQVYRGDLAGAVFRSDEAIAEAAAAHDVLMQAIGLMCETFALALQGDLSRARTNAEKTVQISSELGEYYDLASSGGVAVACLAAGDADEAWKATRAAREHTSSEPMTTGVFVVWTAQAAFGRGDLVAARRWADEAVSVTKGVYLSWALVTRSRVETAHGELQLAERDAHEALVIAASVGGHLLIPEILERLADVALETGSHPEAARFLGAADAIRRRMGAVRFKIFDADHAACVSAIRTQLDDHHFDEAWAEGADLSTEQAIAYAQRGRGERKRPASGWASLTPTELDVVRLVGEGLSNKDIAARLFVSPRTAESHLSHVYSKLGLSSRVQLAQESARHTVD